MVLKKTAFGVLSLDCGRLNVLHTLWPLSFKPSAYPISIYCDVNSADGKYTFEPTEKRRPASRFALFVSRLSCIARTVHSGGSLFELSLLTVPFCLALFDLAWSNWFGKPRRGTHNQRHLSFGSFSLLRLLLPLFTILANCSDSFTFSSPLFVALLIYLTFFVETLPSK